jgi:hypothetical protein
VSRGAQDSGTSLARILWCGAVIGVAVGVAQLAFSLPSAQYSGFNTRDRAPLIILAVLVGMPVSGLVVGALAARRLRLKRPVLVAVAGLLLSIGLASVTLWLGVPHLTVAADPGVWCFGAACAVPGYAAAALIVVPPWRRSAPLRCAGVLAAAVAVVVAGSLAWLEVAYALRAQTLTETGEPLVAADIPGYRLHEVTVDRGVSPGTELSYVRSSDPGDVIDLRVRPDAGQPRDCAGARAVLGRRGTTYTCRDMGDRWVLQPPGERRHVVVATHDGVAVLLSGTAPEVVRATLRTASARELAEARPGAT